MMTEEWFDKLYKAAGTEMWNAHVNRLLEEFKYLGESRNAEIRKCGQCDLSVCECADF
jgi:hypothetical protein